MDLLLDEKTKKNIEKVFGVSYEELISMSEDEREQLVEKIKSQNKNAKQKANKEYGKIKTTDGFEVKTMEELTNPNKKVKKNKNKEKVNEEYEKIKATDGLNVKPMDEMIKE